MTASARMVALAACAVIALFGISFALGGGASDAPPETDRSERSGPDAAAPPSIDRSPASEACSSAGSAPPASRRRGEVLSNGCEVSRRGIPACGTLLGSSLTNNGDPTSWERSMGEHLGVRRTYYQAWKVDEALARVQADTAVGRIPWISFKPPYGWQEMAAGEGDFWARDLAARLSEVDGPVWLAIHHEPENDGDITMWTKMQERLAPMIRSRAPNVAYSVILTGWNAFHGPNQAYRLNSVYPDTTIDLVGFDVYNKYGNADGVATQTDLGERFFDEIAPWAEAHDVAWGLAETGYGDEAARDMPQWLAVTYDQLAAAEGVAMTYWNSSPETADAADYSLDLPIKARSFSKVLLRSPKLRGRPITDASCSPSAPSVESR